MTESKALILGCSGLSLTKAERTFYAAARPWGFILFARNVSQIRQIADLVGELRECVGRADAPVLIDQEGGRVQRIRPPLAARYPAGAAIGALYERDRDDGLRAAWLLGRLHAFDLSRCGISVDCLPVLDTPVEGGHDVIGDRAYAKHPQAVAAIGCAVAEGLRAGGLLPVMKHIPGHGRAMADTHAELARVDAPLRELESHDFAPFRAMRHAAMAMTAHVIYSAIDADAPATQSRVVIDTIVRGSIGFDGLLISDDLSMQALAGGLEERVRRIFAAGCDIALHCNGNMDEMRAVANAAPVLAGRARERADAVMGAFQTADGADETRMRAEFEECMALA